jgi:glycosyltransferase involved in cell wall biosynthesis
MVGALIWRKGYEYGLMAFRRLVDQMPAMLTVVGDGDEMERLTAVVEDLGLRGCVEWVGRRDQVAVRQALWESDLFLHASLSEGLANVVLEAMACSLPVVCADSGGMREAIDDEETGFLVAPRDVEAMAGRLLKLSRDDKLRERMGLSGRRRVLERFNLITRDFEFNELYEKAIRRHSGHIS